MSVIVDRTTVAALARFSPTTLQVSLTQSPRPLSIARAMDGSGVVPTLSSGDVDTAAQVLSGLFHRLFATD